MLPELFSSSYKQYKNDTSAFTTWLGRAAEACGYKPPAKEIISETVIEKPEPEVSKAEPPKHVATPVPAPRLKGKARKEAKEAEARLAKEKAKAQAQAKSAAQPEKSAKINAGIEIDHVRTVKEYAVSTQELQEQIDIIAQAKEKISMPSGIKKLLARAIDARKRCSEWFESAHLEAAFDNGGHRHFIGILQDALAKLSSDTTTEQPSPRPAKPATKAAAKTTIADLENRFNLLEVEDVDDSFALSPTQVAVATRPKANKEDEEVDVFTLLTDHSYDNGFSVYCFFEDLHNIRKALRQIWADCVSGKTPLVVATAVTQSAITMIRRAENDMHSILVACDPEDSYSAFLSTMIPPHQLLPVLQGGLSRIEHASADISPFDDFIFLSTARIVGKFAREARLNQHEEVIWPPPIPPIFSVGTDNESPERKQLKKDDILLTQLLLEQELPDWLKKNLNGTIPQSAPDIVDPVNEDIFFKTMRPLWMTGKISLTVVVTGQIMLDIHHASGTKMPRFNGELLHAANYMSDTFGVNGKDRPGSVMLPFGKAEEAALSTVDDLDRTFEPRIPFAKVITMQVRPERKIYALDVASVGGSMPSSLSEFTTAAKGVHNFVSPAPADDFAVTHNPLYSGGRILKLLLDYHACGLQFASQHLTILVTAHLYNALRQLKMLETPWPVMDRIIQLHKKEIFANDIPTKVADMTDRIAYRLNLSKLKSIKQSKWEEMVSLKEPAATETLRLMMKEDVPHQNLALAKIEERLEDDNKSAMVLAKQSTAMQLPTGRRVTPAHYFAALESAFTFILDDVSIDYMRLTRACVDLLDRFRHLYNAETTLVAPDIHFAETFKGSRSVARLNVVHECFQEAKALRESGIYTYAAGDGGDLPQRGRIRDATNPARHGMGMKAASTAFATLLKNESTPDFMFPIRTPNAALLEDPEASNSTGIEIAGRIRRLHTESEFHSVLASSTYVVVHFYNDMVQAHDPTRFFTLCRKHAVEGIFTFVRVNVDDMREEAAKYYKDRDTQLYVFFKDGKQVAVNGMMEVKADDAKSLKAAVAKVGGLAKKRLAERSQQK